MMMRPQTASHSGSIARRRLRATLTAGKGLSPARCNLSNDVGETISRRACQQRTPGVGFGHHSESSTPSVGNAYQASYNSRQRSPKFLSQSLFSSSSSTIDGTITPTTLDSNSILIKSTGSPGEFHSTWQKTTKRLLDEIELGEFSGQTFEECQMAIHHWMNIAAADADHRDSNQNVINDSVDYVLRLLDRMYQEEHVNNGHQASDLDIILSHQRRR